jgi:hypothetical protein
VVSSHDLHGERAGSNGRASEGSNCDGLGVHLDGLDRVGLRVVEMLNWMVSSRWHMEGRNIPLYMSLYRSHVPPTMITTSQ